MGSPYLSPKAGEPSPWCAPRFQDRRRWRGQLKQPGRERGSGPSAGCMRPIPIAEGHLPPKQMLIVSGNTLTNTPTIVCNQISHVPSQLAHKINHHAINPLFKSLRSVAVGYLPSRATVPLSNLRTFHLRTKKPRTH